MNADSPLANRGAATPADAQLAATPPDTEPAAGPAVGRHRRAAEQRTDAAKERFLRPFAVDAGVSGVASSGPFGSNGVTGADLDLLSLVVAARTPGGSEWLRPEREALLNCARHARPVAELATEVGLPVGQVRAMVADMIMDGSLQRCGPSRRLGREDLLHAVLVGLQSL